MRHSISDTAPMTASATGSSSRRTELKLANMRSCSTRNSFGSISRITKLDRLRNSSPKMMPTSIIRCRLRTASANSQRNSRQAKAVMTPTSSRNAATGWPVATAACPKTYTTSAWINR